VNPRPILRLLLGAMLALPASCARPSGEGALIVFNAGSLGYPFHELLVAFAREHPGVASSQESSGSLEAARKLTELGKIPDLLAVADAEVIAKLLIPSYAGGYVGFASNAMVLAYTDRSSGAAEISSDTWWRILLRPEVRWGLSNAALDPNGYRSHMVFQLAERRYHVAGLAARLEDAIQPNYVRPNEAQLLSLVQAGELDYAWSYRSLAVTAGLRWVTLPREIDLSDPDRVADYAVARVRLPGTRLGSTDSVEFRGAPILYAFTIPNGAPHLDLARAFARFLLGPSGQAVLRRSGFVVLDRPRVVGVLPF
jgi:molybdate/tungstate transport system substrate-binding protein